MIFLGDTNTRERDYADVLMLSRTHAVEAYPLKRPCGRQPIIAAQS
jgi:hypothetical protein